MLLKQLLEVPHTSSTLVVYDPFKLLDPESLLKEVIGLANADVDGPRNILFGVNPSAIDGNSIVGIDEATVRELKRAHRLVSAHVEPGLDLAFIFDRINGKLVGALEIDGCDFGPYFMSGMLSGDEQRGTCWVRDGHELKAVSRRAVTNGRTPNVIAAPEPETLPEEIRLSFGFNDDPDCDFIEVDVPDTSDPPFEQPANDSDGSLRFTQTLKTKVSTMTAQVLKRAPQEDDQAVAADDTHNAGAQIADAVRKHFFLEERAVKVDICVRNDCGVDLRNLTFEVGFPSMPGFDVAHRIYSNPFDKRSEAGREKLDYPDVEFQDDGAIVRAKIVRLPADTTQSVIGTPLRLAVGAEALGRKIAMPYVMRSDDGREIAAGRLKVRLGQAAAKRTANAI